MHETKQHASESTLTVPDAYDSKTKSRYQLKNKTNTKLNKKQASKQINKQEQAIKNQESVF